MNDWKKLVWEMEPSYSPGNGAPNASWISYAPLRDGFNERFNSGPTFSMWRKASYFTRFPASTTS